MSRKRSRPLGKALWRLVDGLFGRGDSATKSGSPRHLGFEPLEGRAMLHGDLAGVTGLVTLAGSPISGAQMVLFSSDGDALFEPGAGDTQLDTAVTDGTGRYLFDRLEDGDYWVQQPAQTVGADDLGAEAQAFNISHTDSQGILDDTLDDFLNATVQAVQADDVVGTIDSLATDYAGAVGGERDLSVELTAGTVGDFVRFDSQMGRLQFTSTTTAQGEFTVVYDGNDDDATALAATGLGGVDFTNAGANTALTVRIRASQVGANMRMRIYTDATHFSDSQPLPFPVPGTNTDTDVIFYFADFAAGSGAVGPADFSDVGAVEMLVQTTTNATSGHVSLLGLFAPTLETLDFDNQADLALTKTVNEEFPSIGQNVIFTVTVTNAAGGAGATNVVVTDMLPAGATHVSNVPSQGTYTPGTGLWDVGSIAAGASATLQITATIATAGAKTNEAEITAADQTDPDSTPGNNNAAEDDQDLVVVTPAQIDLSLVKTVDDATPLVGQNVVFTLNVGNGGADAATNVVIEDMLPAGLTFVSSVASQGSYVSGTGVWTVGTINAAGSATLTITATVATAGAKVNSAEVTAADQNDLDSTPDNNVPAEDDQDSVTVTPEQADLSLQKTVNDSTPISGQNVTFTLTVANAGPAAATGVVVEDMLPAGLTFVSSTPSQGSYVAGTGLWTVGSILSGANATLQIVATVTTIGAKVNTAEVFDVDQADTDSTPDNNLPAEDDQASVTVTPEVADLSITKTVDDSTPDRNQNVVFTIIVTNGGPQAATGVQVTDLLPAGLTFVSNTVTQGAYVSGTGIWTVGTINSGATATLTITATTATSAVKVNTAEVTDSDQFDGDSTPNNQVGTEDDQASVTVTPNISDLSITKTVDDSTPNRNQNVVFTIIVTNGGPIAATGVTVSDALPAGLTFVSANTATGSYSNATGIWTVGNLASAGTATLTITATTNTIGAKVNTAQVAASNQFDGDSTPGNSVAGEDDQASVTVTPTVADLSLTKTVNLPTQSVGQNVIFTLTVANGGPDAASGVTVSDLLPAGLTFVSSTPSQGTYNQSSGVWTVGSINSGANATLTITATIATVGAKANTAQITASDQFDGDSTPGNNTSGEDDQATTSVTPPARFSKRLFLAKPMP